MIKYGLISETDSRTLEKTIDLICASFNDDIINITEVGVYGGDTGNGMCEYLKLKNRLHWITGIDNFKDNEPIRFPYNTTIRGNSNEVYNQLEDNSQHLVVVDGGHSFPTVVADFFCYAPKVKVGGVMAFHDTNPLIAKFKDWQRMGDEKDPDMSISVRKALKHIGLLDNQFKGWELLYDEYDPENEASGFCCFKKLPAIMPYDNLSLDNMAEEVWASVPFNSKFVISNIGRVKAVRPISMRTHTYPKILKQQFTKQKYLFVRFKNEKGVAKNYLVHQLVAKAFLENPLGRFHINHKDGVKQNNRAENLEWTTPLENTRHSNKMGLVNIKGTKNYSALLNEEQVLEIFNSKEPSEKICAKYGVSGSAVRNIRNGKTWGSVTGKVYKQVRRYDKDTGDLIR